MPRYRVGDLNALARLNDEQLAALRAFRSDPTVRSYVRAMRGGDRDAFYAHMTSPAESDRIASFSQFMSENRLPLTWATDPLPSSEDPTFRSIRAFYARGGAGREGLPWGLRDIGAGVGAPPERLYHRIGHPGVNRYRAPANWSPPADEELSIAGEGDGGDDGPPPEAVAAPGGGRLADLEALQNRLRAGWRQVHPRLPGGEIDWDAYMRDPNFRAVARAAAGEHLPLADLLPEGAMEAPILEVGGGLPAGVRSVITGGDEEEDEGGDDMAAARARARLAAAAGHVDRFGGEEAADEGGARMPREPRRVGFAPDLEGEAGRPVFGRQGARPAAVDADVRRVMGDAREALIGLPEAYQRDFERLKRFASAEGITAAQIEGLEPARSSYERKLINRIKRSSEYLGLEPALYTDAVPVVNIRPLSEEEWRTQGFRAVGPGALPRRPSEDPLADAPPEVRERMRGVLPFPAGLSAAGEFTGQPRYITEATKYLVERALQESAQPRIPYPGEKVAPLSDEQMAAADMIHRYIDESPYQEALDEAKDRMRASGNVDVAMEIEPDIADASRSAARHIGEYDDPYKELVIDRMYTKAFRNYKDKVLKPLEHRLAAKGMFHSSRRPELIRQSLEDLQENLLDKEAQLRHKSFYEGLGHAQQDQSRRMQAAALKGNTRARDIQAKLEASKQLHKAGLEEEEHKLKQADLLRMMGTERYNIDQARRSAAAAEFEAQQAHRRAQTALAADIVRGLPANTARFATSPVVPQQPVVPSSWTAAGGLMQGVGGMLAGAHAKGGVVEAPEMYTGTPTQEAYMASMQDAANQVRRSKSSPMWDFISHMGFNIAASKDPHFGSRLGAAARDAMPTFYAGRERNKAADLQALNLQNKMLESRMLLEKEAKERERKKEREKAEVDLIKMKIAELDPTSEVMPRALRAQMMKQQKEDEEKKLKKAHSLRKVLQIATRMHESAIVPRHKLKDVLSEDDEPIIVDEKRDLVVHPDIGRSTFTEQWTSDRGSRPERRALRDELSKLATELANIKMEGLPAKAMGPSMQQHLLRGIPNPEMQGEAYAKILSQNMEDALTELRLLLGRDEAEAFLASKAPDIFKKLKAAKKL